MLGNYTIFQLTDILLYAITCYILFFVLFPLHIMEGLIDLLTLATSTSFPLGTYFKMNSLAQMQNADFGSNTFIQFNHHHYLVHDILLFVYPDFINKIFVLNKMCQQNFMHWIRKKYEVERNEKRKKNYMNFLIHKCSKFSSILLEHFVESKNLIYEVYILWSWSLASFTKQLFLSSSEKNTLWWSKIQNKY